MKNIINKYRSWISYGIKVIISILILISIYFEVFQNQILSRCMHVYETAFIIDNLFPLLFLLFLSALNWFLEAFRWRAVMQSIEEVSMYESLKAILSGLGISAFSPNRVGEFIGRVVYLKRANKVRGVLLNFVSNSALILTSYLAGYVSCLYFLSLWVVQKEWWYYLIIGSLGLFGLILIYLYFNWKDLSLLLYRVEFLNRFGKYWSTFNLLSFKKLIYYWSLAILRYLVFTFQYLMVLKLFQVDIAFFEAVVSIWTIFFIQLVIPTFILLEIGVRGKAALSVIGYFSMAAPELILASSLALWLINLILPALIGFYFILRLNFWKAIRVQW